MSGRATTAREWVDARAGGVPPALVSRMHGALTAASVAGVTIPEALAAASEQQLSDALRASPMTRAQALDVLGADALLTFAFEAAADDPSMLTARADAAMLRVAALATGPQ